MLFNSIEFCFFLPIVFLLYWFVSNKKIKQQNVLLLVASYFFYGWWDWRFLTLIVFSSFVDYHIGIQLSKINSEKTRKLLLITSILVNLGFLGFFKYFNFFAENFTNAFTLLGNPIEASRLNIILPVGISFYTFQTLSYSIDIYKRKLEPTRDIVAFFAFVSFFPQLVAGPIERATNLLPQFYKKRKFDYTKAVDGMRQILWGLFKKVVIADNCAEYANIIFNNSNDFSGSTLVLGAVFFTFQIYGDFSGYSDIAIGTSRLFGFNLKKNFAFPYFSRDIAEFWRRWHMSLSTWFRDYLYIPLGGSRGGTWMKIRNTFIIFIVSGFWHGANWTFIAWGALNAVYFLPLLLLNKNRVNTDSVAQGKYLPTFRELINMGITFSLTVLAWVFFRAENIGHAWRYLSEIFSPSLFKIPYFYNGSLSIPTICLIIFLMIIEWIGRENEYAIEKLGFKWKRPLRLGFYYSVILLIYYYGGKEQQFIYFQF
ncbi:MBOAT family O-acyltransferase [Tenacibaculum aiptasiae]|uniref:MBOAT family O-acyltransferase n=1 Tax=Tenacibaculum aiptasiae TaxID=426481 RepID=UPI00232AD8E4|nr:MBOAT family O-acyltransferase [Tenacibaculum aiptasiae]